MSGFPKLLKKATKKHKSIQIIIFKNMKASFTDLPYVKDIGSDCLFCLYQNC